MNASSICSPSCSSIDGSEESFVVLNESAEQDLPDQMPSGNSSLLKVSLVCPAIPNVPVTDQVSQSSSLMSNSSTWELSAEEIQFKMESLIQENLQLKNTLNKNNLAMRNQFNTLVQWQEEVKKVNELHKEKFEKTKKIILELRAENYELKNKSCNSTNSDEISLELKSKISALEVELDILRQANNKYKSEQSKIVQDLEIKLSDLSKEKEENLLNLNNQIDCLNAQLKKLNDEKIVVEHKVAELLNKVPTEAEIEEKNNIKENLHTMTLELMLKNKVLLEKTELIGNLREEISKLKIDNETTTIPILIELNILRQANNKYKNEQSKIVQDLEIKLSDLSKEKEENLLNLNNQIDCLNAQLKKLNDEKIVVEHKVAELLNKVPTEAEIEEKNNIKEYLRTMTLELMLKNKILEDKEELIKNLYKEISKLKIDNETIPILKTQVEGYQSDLNQEREARSLLEEEKDRLQRRNQNLLQVNIELHIKREYVHASVPSAPNPIKSSQSSSRDRPEPVAILRCMVCGARFHSLLNI